MSSSSTNPSQDQRIWKTLSILALSTFFYALDILIIGPLLPSLMEMVNSPLSQGGLLITGYSICAGLSALVLAPLSDQLGHKKMLLIGLLVLSISDTLIPFTSSFELLLVVRGTAGVGGAMILSNSYALVSDLFPYNRRGKAVGVLMISAAMANLFGVPLGMAITELTSVQWIYWGIAVYSWIPLVLLFAFFPKHHHENQFEVIRSVADYLAIFKQPFILPFVFICLICTYLWYVGANILFQYLGIFYKSQYDVSTGQIGILYFLTSAGYFLGTVISGKISDRVGKKRIILLASAGTAIGSVLFALFYQQSLVAAMVILVPWVFTIGLAEGSLVALISGFATTNRGIVLSINVVFTYLGFATATAISSVLLSQYSFFSLGVTSAVVFGVLITMLLFFVKEARE